MKTAVVSTIAAVLASLAMAQSIMAEKAENLPEVLKFQVKSLDGQPVDLAKYRGQVLLVVNVASRCGFTPQYEGLQALYEKYADKGLRILAFPCNQFGRQEPGSPEEIAQFCSQNYGVTFDLFEKIDVNGENAAPLYRYLTSPEASGEKAGPVKWNFEKFLIGRDGRVVARFRSPVSPTSDEMIKAIETELNKG